MTASSPSCSQCGTRLKPGLPVGLCLGCLLTFGLKHRAPDDADAPEDNDASTAHPFIDTFDRYRILEKLGEGGCGVVYRAQQLEPLRREVALKVIKLGMDTTNVITRFEAERQALALMDHPGIAKVFDAGKSRQGRPFFAMELVVGERITDYCDRHRLSIPQRLEIFVQVCEAVQHAHQKGIIHRDLKPSNVLVSQVDGVPQSKVIDFGIAKATSRQRLANQTIYTAFDQFIGTPAYMSPEQAGTTGEDIDTRSDIYSLGVLLYELLTGRLPFEPERLRQAAVDEVLRIIRDEDPSRPSARLTTLAAPELNEISRCRLATPPKLVRELSGDLDWVVMKALEKLPSRRYETASALAVEVRRHLHNEPVQARPPSASYRFRKLVRRNRVLFGTSSLVLGTLVAGTFFSSWRFLKEREARRLSDAAEQTAKAEAVRANQVAGFMKEMLTSVGPSVALGRDTTMLKEILGRTAERVGNELKDHPDIEAELRVAIGRAYLDLGELSKAEQMHRAALRLREAYFGPTHPAVAESLLCLCAVFSRRSGAGDVVEGESLARRAVAIQDARSPRAEVELAGALEQLGWNLEVQGRSVEARPLHRRVLDLRRHLPGSLDLHLVNSLNALSASLTRDTNALDEAEALLREALTLQTKTSLEASPVTADLFHTLSVILEKRKDLSGAEEAIQKSIAMRRTLWGAGNVMLADPLARLAQVLDAEGKLPEAEAALRECITILTNSYGTGNLRTTGRFMGTLTELLQRQQKWPEAELSARAALALFRANQDSSPEMFYALHWLQIILSAQGKWAETEPLLRELIALCDQLSTTTSSHIETAKCMHLRRALGETMLRIGNYAAAEPLLITSYAALKGSTHHWDQVNVELCLKHLVELCQATARPAQADVWKKGLADFQKARAGQTKPIPNP